jgi:hypothetical protein
MLKPLCLLYLFTIAATVSIAQKKPPAAVNAIMGIDEGGGKTYNEFKTASASKILEIKIPAGGANGAAVIYHPKEKLFYAAQAGNKEFPLVIFDADGNIKSSESQTTFMDVRGLWYNPKTKKIGGNGYKEFGWFTYDLDRNGMPEGINVFKEGRYQPDDHSAGVLNTEDDEVLFLDGVDVKCYSTSGEDRRKNIQLHIGSKNISEGTGITVSAFEENYNTRSIIYTGITGSEIGLLNISKKQVELYNIKTGYMTKIVALPLSFKPESFFNFSYANNLYWVFNKETRYWHGFKEN